MKFVLAPCAGLLFPFVVFAQAPSSTPAAPTLKVTTHLVVLNVVVTDGEQLDWSISRAVTSPLLFNGILLTASGKRLASGPVTDKKSKNVAGAASVLLTVNQDSLSWTTPPNGDERSEVTLVTSEMSFSGQVLRYRVREVEVVVEKAQGGEQRYGAIDGANGTARQD